MTKFAPSYRFRYREPLHTSGQRAKRVDAILKIVNAEGCNVRRKDIEELVDYMDELIPRPIMPAGLYFIASKTQKLAASRIVKAVSSLERALSHKKVGPKIAGDFSKALKPVLTLRDRLRSSAKIPLRGNSNLSLRKRHAVMTAAEFCLMHGIALKKSKNGAFCRLSAILYSQTGASRGSGFYRLCRDFLKAEGYEAVLN